MTNRLNTTSDYFPGVIGSILNEGWATAPDAWKKSPVITIGSKVARLSPIPDRLKSGSSVSMPVEPPDKSDPYFLWRQSFLVTGLVSSILSGVAYIPISLPLPGGVFFGIGNIVGFSKLNIWAVHDMALEILGPKSRAERDLEARCQPKPWVNTVGATLGITTALLSQLPNALPVLDYQKQFKELAALCVLFSGALIPMRSIQLAFSKWFLNRHPTPNPGALEIERIRSLLTTQIHAQSQSHQQCSFEKYCCLEGNDPNEVSNELLQQVLLNPTEIPPTSSLKCVTLPIGVALATTMQVALAWYTFTKSQQDIVNNPWVAALLSGTVVLSNAYLSTRSIIATTHRVAAGIISWLDSSEPNSFAVQRRPLQTRLLRSLGLASDVGSLGAIFVIWTAFYKDNEALRAYFVSSLCLCYFLFLFTSTLDLTEKIMSSQILKTGTKEEQNFVLCQSQLNRLETLILNSPSKDLLAFILSWPEEIQRQACDKWALSLEKIQELVPILNSEPDVNETVAVV